MSNELDFSAQCYQIEILTLNYVAQRFITTGNAANILTHGYLYYQNDLNNRSQELNKVFNIGYVRGNQLVDHTTRFILTKSARNSFSLSVSEYLHPLLSE